MEHDVRIFDDAHDLAIAAATVVAERAFTLQSRDEPFTFAVSGGKTPWAMIAELAHLSVRWDHSRIFQVDERVVPATSDLRNLKGLEAALTGTNAPIEMMDVEASDLDDACERYAVVLPDRFDLVHLGLGPDGHCASLIPGDPVLQVTDRLVAVAGPYQETMRMTLTYPALERADQLLWLVSGEDKRDALAKLLAHDPSIPAGRVSASASLVMADRSAFG